VGYLDIACSADARYVPHSAAMLHSALANAGGRSLRIHYLHGPDLAVRSRRRLAAMVKREGGSISFLQIPEARIAGLPRMRFVTATMWYRIFLPELLPSLERILYLDVDTIVLDCLEPLWDLDLTDQYVGAVTNVFQQHEAHHPQDLGLAPGDYFNTGVLLMNLALMRGDGCTAALRDHALTHRDELEWPDQDTLNVVLGARRLALHPRWNCMNSMLSFPWSQDVFGAEALDEARRDPGIRHFEGPTINKPWHLLCDREMRSVYFNHRRQTPWPRTRLRGMTPRNILRRFARDGQRVARATARRGRLSA
jgi:lipopolysaccharide biosynthesis glycosyltransferase